MRILTFLALFGTALAVPAPAPRIVGGTQTTIENYPFLTNMQFSYFGETWFQACAGSLITTRSILSTAHCFYGSLPLMWRVRLGTSYAESGGDEYSVSQFVHHPGYDNHLMTNDVSIVHLGSAASLSSTVGLGSIAGPNYILPDGASVTAIGWGRIESEGAFPEQLRQVQLNTINQEICTQRYADLKTQPGFQNYPDVTSGMICTGILNTGGYGTCEGDNGGPIIHNNNVIIGLISWRYRCGLAEYPVVNTRVSSYTDWIVANGSV